MPRSLVLCVLQGAHPDIGVQVTARAHLFVRRPQTGGKARKFESKETSPPAAPISYSPETDRVLDGESRYFEEPDSRLPGVAEFARPVRGLHQTPVPGQRQRCQPHRLGSPPHEPPSLPQAPRLHRQRRTRLRRRERPPCHNGRPRPPVSAQSQALSILTMFPKTTRLKHSFDIAPDVN